MSEHLSEKGRDRLFGYDACITDVLAGIDKIVAISSEEGQPMTVNKDFTELMRRYLGKKRGTFIETKAR